MTNFRKWFKGEYPGGHTSGYYFAHKAWQYRQQEIDQLKAQLNNMEACYIEKKKQVGDQQKRIDEALEDLEYPTAPWDETIASVVKVLRGES